MIFGVNTAQINFWTCIKL